MYLLIISILLIIVNNNIVLTDKCDHVSCPIYQFNQPPGLLKENATQIVKLGYINNDGSESQGYVMMAVANLNNDSSLLPDIKFELYIREFTNTESITIATLKMCSIDVGAIIVNSEDVYVPASSTISLAYQVPTFNNRAEGDIFTDKTNYPMMTRIYPTSATMTQGMVTFIKRYRYTSILALTTDGTSSLDTLQAQAASAGIFNVFTVSIPSNPSTFDIKNAVENCINYIQKYQIRPIIVATTPSSGWLLLASLSNSSIYGNDYLYILSHDMGRSYFILQYTNPMPILYPLLTGSVFFAARDATGSQLMYDFYSQWAARDLNYYPASATITPRSQMYVYDGVSTYAHALNLVLKNGKYLENVTADDILSMIPNVAFNGVTGPVGFDINRDSYGYGGYNINNLVDPAPLNPVMIQRGVYNPGNNTFTGPMNFTYYGGSLIPPNPGYCQVCVHGTCNSDSICVCFPGYQGDYCSDKTDKNVNIVYYVPAIVVFVIIVVIAIVIIFKRQRRTWIKKLYEEQASIIEKDELKILEEVGRGASGIVSKGSFRGTDVAIKTITTGSVSDSTLENFKYETSIMCSLRHTNIVIFMGSCFNEEEGKLLLVMEFCPKGSLHDLLNNKNIDLSLELIVHLASQAALGMNFLHQSGLIHCDLKSYNVLVDDRYTAKIADFGISRFKNEKRTSYIRASAGTASSSKSYSGKSSSSSKNSNESNEVIGTVFWTAPEVLLGEPHTPKSDSYSFGIVLWELFHRKDPYPGKDLHAVATAVALKGLRPEINPIMTMPQEIYNLMKSCQNQNPDDRPDFKTIANSLRHMATKFPVRNYSVQRKSHLFPTGKVYIVESKIDNYFHLFNLYPRAMQHAKEIHDRLINQNIILYGGYLLKQKKSGFLIVFSNCIDATNWCIAINHSLNSTIDWPHEIINELRSSTDTLLWSGLRIRTSINVGEPEAYIDSSDRNNYMGPVIDKTIEILKNTNAGSILVTSSVAHDIEIIQSDLIEKVTLEKFDDKRCLVSVLPNSLLERFSFKDDMELSADNSIALSYINQPLYPNWFIRFNDFILNDDIGKGQVSNVKKGILLSGTIPIAVKILINQNLKEEDYLHLLADTSIISKIEHKNLLKIYGICLKRNNISIIAEYAPKSNLFDLINNHSITLSLPVKHRIAHQISLGMDYLTTYDKDNKIQIHDSLKTNNILIMDDEFNIKVSDYGQNRIRELARTMTSIGVVSYTAPEILNGDPVSVKSSIYAFGIIMWELYTRKIAYQNENVMKLVTKVLNGYRPNIKECPIVVQELIQSCMNEDPASRPTWDMLQQQLMLL